MVGTRIKQYLTDNGIKQSFLVRKTGLSAGVISDMLAGIRRIEVSEYFNICDALNVPLETFKEEGREY